MGRAIPPPSEIPMKITIKHRVGFGHGTKVGSDEWLFDTDTLTESQYTNLKYWMKSYPETVIRREVSKAAPAPIIDTRPAVIERPAMATEFVDPVAEDFKRDVQRQIDLSQAQERLNFWGRAHGLRDSERNQSLIIEWFEKNVNGYLSGAGVDAAVANLRASLDWDAPKAAPAGPPKFVQQKDEILGTLPNGEKQLSIKTNPPSNASAAQCKAWLQRYRAANNRQFNSFGR